MRVLVYNHLPVLPRAGRTLDGQSNVVNAGIYHLGRRGPGTEAACGNRRAHMTFERSKFDTLPEDAKCGKCKQVVEKWARIKERRQTGDTQGDIDDAFAQARKFDKFGYAKGLDGFVVVNDYDKWNAAYIPTMDMVEVQRKFIKHPFKDQVQMFLHEMGHRGEELDPKTYQRYIQLKLNTVQNFLAMANLAHRENYKKTGHDDIDAETFAESYSRYCLGWPMPEALRKFWEVRAEQ